MSLTDLMEATGRGDLEGVKANLNQVGKKNWLGETALMKAAINGHANCIPLLEKEIGMQNNIGWTALMLAASNGKIDCVRLLLSEAGRQTTEERYGLSPRTTALMIAAHENYPEVVELLLPYEQGLKDSNGRMAKWYAYNSSWGEGITRVRKLLENEGTERIPPPLNGLLLFLKSAMMGDVDGVRKHLDHAGYQDSTGKTALIHAVCLGQANCIPLLEKEFGLQDNDSYTALMHAAKRGHSECIPLLEGEVGMQDDDGRTALMWAAYNGHTDCVRLLLSEAGKQTTEEWDDFPPGTTALMMAAHYNDPEIVELLLPYEQGLKDSEGHTAQWYANNIARGGDFTRVRKLLKNEGTTRLPPPSDPTEILKFLERVDKLTTENESLKKDLSSSKNE
ncbi:Ankyrin repeat protein 1 [Giardia muris]|uniref:Ankyrin repeat protein 1 n=1 Tax=Giardia muris TaxID=5742 RepID=A0A4Z1SN49_GIAMU|nr:Ankyrin repeat protein 1 [Giardia muris]|eukprot:TNJ27020.1 Ankyrin repeat protein 1 [Giardia muris]